METEPPAEQKFRPAILPEDLGPPREAVERLEALKLSTGEKIDVLLVELGVKPATLHMFSSRTTNTEEEPGTVNEAAFRAFMEAVQDAGLLIEVSPDRIVDPNEEIRKGTEGAIWIKPNETPPPTGQLRQVRRTVYMAKTPGNLALMKQADAENDATLFGRAYGFPPTATAAHLEARTISVREVTADPELIAFAQFGLSPEHAEQELETARAWARATQATSPKMYAEAVGADQAETDNAETAEESEPEPDQNKDQGIVKLIEQRIELRRNARELRLAAIQRVLDHDLLEEFPDLKISSGYALKEGLAQRPATPTIPTDSRERDALISEIQAQISQADAADHQADALTAEIMSRTRRG